jgi:hypothetical protein
MRTQKTTAATLAEIDEKAQRIDMLPRKTIRKLVITM